jgi:transposase
MRIHHVDAAMLKTLSDAELIDLLQAKYKGGAKDFIEPDWDHVYREFQKANVTIALLYSEYSDSCAGKKGGAVRSEASFGRKLREHCKARGLSMRQEHLPGQEMFVDFSGKHLYLTNRETGERTPVEIFVASLGNSQLMFITAVASQKMPDWIEANVRAFEYFGGVSAMTIPDNLKSGVDKPAHRGHEARINRSYIDFAEHYGTVIVPARPLHPQDKALAEIAVRITNMWVIGQLRNHVFYSLGEMNAPDSAPGREDQQQALASARGFSAGTLRGARGGLPHALAGDAARIYRMVRRRSRPEGLPHRVQPRLLLRAASSRLSHGELLHYSLHDPDIQRAGLHAGSRSPAWPWYWGNHH